MKQKMTELNISPNSTIDDIHKIREYNYEQTKNLSPKEQNEYYEKKTNAFLKEAGITPKMKDEPIKNVM